MSHKDSTEDDAFSRFRTSGSSKSVHTGDFPLNPTEPARSRQSEGSNKPDFDDDEDDRTVIIDTEMLDQLDFANNTIQQLQDELAALKANVVNASEYERLKSERDAAIEQLEVEMGANVESEASWRRLIEEQRQQNVALQEQLAEEKKCQSALLSTSEEESASLRQQLEQAKVLLDNTTALTETLRSQLETIQHQNEDINQKVLMLGEESSTLRSQVSCFEQEKAVLVGNIEALNKQLLEVQESNAADEDLQAKVDNQHEMLVFAKSTIEELTAQVSELEATGQSFAKEISEKDALIVDLKAQLKEKDAQIAANAETIQSLEEKVQENGVGISEMERNMQEIFSLMSDAKAKEEILENRLSEEEEKTLELADQVLRLERQFEGAINDLTAEKILSNQLKQDVNNAAVVVQNYERELFSITDSLKTSAEKVVELEKAVEDLTHQLAAATEAAAHIDSSESAKKERQIQQMHAELGGKEAEISRLMKCLQEVQSRCDVAEQELDQARVRENQNSGDEESMKKRIGQLQTTVDLLKSEKDILTRKLAESESALETLYNESCSEKERLVSQVDVLTKQIDKLHSEVFNASQSAAAVEALETKIAAIKVEKDAADEEVKRLVQLTQELQNKLNDSIDATGLRNDNDHLKATVVELEGALAEANQRLKKAKDDATMLTTELDRVESDSRVTKSERDELVTELEKALQQVQELTDALVEAENLKSDDTAATSQVQELISKISALESDIEAKDRTIESFKEEIQELKDATMILPQLDSEELDTLKQEKQESDQKLLTIQAECAELKSVINKYSSMLQRGQEALQDAFDDNEMLKTRGTELEEKLEEINKKYKIAAERESSLQDMCNSLSLDIKEKDRALQRLHAEVSTSKQVSEHALASSEKADAAEDHIAQLREERDSMSAEYSQMRDELRSLKQQYELAESALESARRELAEVVDTKDKRIAHLEKHKLTKEHLEMINKLKDERKKYQEDCKTMKRQLSDLKKAYETLRDSGAAAADESKLPSRSSQAASGSIEDKPKDLAGLESELIIAKGELDASHSLVLSLKNKLRDCSKQLQVSRFSNSTNLTLLLLISLNLCIGIRV